MYGVLNSVRFEICQSVGGHIRGKGDTEAFEACRYARCLGVCQSVGGHTRDKGDT